MQAFLVVAPSIACYDEYGGEMAQHLLEAKLRHWEASLRDLAARGLAKLVPCQPHLLASTGLDFLIPSCNSATIEVRLTTGE